MGTALKGIFTSKKFYMVVIGSAVVWFLGYFGASSEIISSVAALFGLGIAGQGLADLGKNAKTPS